MGLTLTGAEAGKIVSLRTFPNVPLFNRTLNLGMHSLVTDAALTDLLTVARDSNMAQLLVGVSPGVQSGDLRERLLQRGARPARATMQLTRALEVQQVGYEHLHVGVMGAGDQAAFVNIMVRGISMPPELAAFTRSLFRREGWTHYLDWRDETAVACASLHIIGDAAWFGSAASPPEHWGLRAQTALIARRLNDAARARVRTCST